MGDGGTPTRKTGSRRGTGTRSGRWGSQRARPSNLDPRRRRPSDGGRPTLLFAGRLLPWKGVFLALKALELLPEWQLVICGTGPDETRIRRLAKRWGLLHRTEFRGWVPRSELASAMREEADVFLLPGLHDDAGWWSPRRRLPACQLCAWIVVWASPAGRSSSRYPITSEDGGSTRERRCGGTSPWPWEGCGSFRATDAPAGDVGAPWTPGRLSFDTHRLTIISRVCNSAESGRPTSLVLRQWQTIGCCVRAGIELRPDARTRHR